MNRGLAKRAVFVSLPEIRFFKSRMAREVRAGVLEVFSFCFLTTHFHLLVRSPRGEMADGMRRIENSFVRWFNRRHRRDGSLFRGRFTSRCVDDEIYRDNVVRYIDRNPVSAGLVAIAEEYAHGSARFRRLATAPPWLSSYEAIAREGSSTDSSEHAAWVIERRLEKRTAPDRLDDLFGTTRSQVRAWMRRKAKLADGTEPASCVVSPSAVSRALETVRRRHAELSVSLGSRTRDGWPFLEIGLCRDLAGLTTTETALLLGAPRGSVAHVALQHRHLLLVDEDYGDRAAEVLERALRITYGAHERRKRSSTARLDMKSSLAPYGAADGT